MNTIKQTHESGVKIETGLCCRNEDQSLRVWDPVPDKPQFWFVRKSLVSFSFGFRRTGKPAPMVEMHEDEILAFYFKGQAARDAYDMTTTGSGPNKRIRKLRDRKPFRRQSVRFLPRKFKPSMKEMLREADERVRTRLAAKTA